MRVQIRSQQLDEETWWRICEPDGALVDCWLPWESPRGPVDRGGFLQYLDAVAFCLGLDWIRARAGTLDGLTTGDIDAERAVLDQDRRGMTPLPPPVLEEYVAA